MRIFLIFLFSFVLPLLTKNEEDTRLFGRWRTPVPAGSDHNGNRSEFLFEEKGVFKANRIIYEYNETSEEWSPFTAEQIANGNDDTWETDNSFLTLKVRERNVSTRDQVYRYSLESDTLKLWQGEIFEGKNEALTGKWTYELFDFSSPTQKFSRNIELTSEGKWLETREKGVDENKYVVKDQQLKLILLQLNGREICPADTIAYQFEVKDKKLFLWREPLMLTLIKKN